MADALEQFMRRIAAQSVLFAPKVSRLALHQLQSQQAGDEPAFTVNAWRNHAIEPVLALAEPYFAQAGRRAEVRLGAYDDTLAFAAHSPADLELIWLDSSRYAVDGALPAGWCDWLAGRVAALRSITSAPIIVATWVGGREQRERLQQRVDGLPGVHFGDCEAACHDAGVRLLDARSAALAGTPVGNAAQVVLARKLACHWLPAALLPPLKAVAFDLDHTLHAGVLGEDGIENVQLTAAHAALQRYAKELRERGIFLALVSRNERADVEALFARRGDYPLRLEDFSAVEVAWAGKAALLQRVAGRLRIATDAILFVDDNPGELAEVASRLPGARGLHAMPDASLTQCALEHYPGLWRWRLEADDAKRVRDLQSQAQRQSVFDAAQDAASYFRSLQAVLTVRRDPADQLERVAQLCAKTNQFNLALRRLGAADLAGCMGSGDACVVSVQLRDRLSDSGVVAAVVARLRGDRLEVDELCVSCRALGRHLEDTLVLEAIRAMPQFADCRQVGFHVRHGPRNRPALDWLAGCFGLGAIPAEGLLAVPASALRDFRPAEGVTLVRE